MFAINHCESQWVSQPLPFGVDVYDMKFFDANTGMISAHDQTNGYVFRTTNGGNNWVINSYSIILCFLVHYVKNPARAGFLTDKSYGLQDALFFYFSVNNRHGD